MYVTTERPIEHSTPISVQRIMTSYLHRFQRANFGPQPWLSLVPDASVGGMHASRRRRQKRGRTTSSTVRKFSYTSSV
ncbi:hypothetical protein SCLCIDRAFT_1223403 [Scleroderma citrinum Foug A]|uniref:Uncharacterized protein n=1 Tax=Scleroderma citrinum Foug A TaxID=1036808 RepID=A0A0C2YT97_9AGAM|nr:hypothetical protein SCLCIDRAFT_1223403 [Scleroderma citrinum Foug A]